LRQAKFNLELLKLSYMMIDTFPAFLLECTQPLFRHRDDAGQGNSTHLRA